MDVMPAFYAAVQAIADGQAAEIEVEHRWGDESHEQVLTITVRAEVRHFQLNRDDG